MRPCYNHLCSPTQPNDNRGPNTPPMPMVPPPVPPGMGMEPPRQQGPPVSHMLLHSSCFHAQNWPIKHVDSQIYICNLYMYEYWTCLSPYLMPDTQKGFYSTGKVRLATFCMSVYYTPTTKCGGGYTGFALSRRSVGRSVRLQFLSAL